MDNGLEQSASEQSIDDVAQVKQARIGSGELHPNAPLIKKELAKLMRSPFRRILADYLGFAPTPEAIQRLAEKSPDRWIQGAIMLAGLAGFTKDTTVNVNHNVEVHSDSELRERLALAEQAQTALRATRLLPTSKPETSSLPPTHARYAQGNDDAIDVNAREIMPDDNH